MFTGVSKSVRNFRWGRELFEWFYQKWEWRRKKVVIQCNSFMGHLALVWRKSGKIVPREECFTEGMKQEWTAVHCVFHWPWLEAPFHAHSKHCQLQIHEKWKLPSITQINAFLQIRAFFFKTHGGVCGYHKACYN